MVAKERGISLVLGWTKQVEVLHWFTQSRQGSGASLPAVNAAYLRLGYEVLSPAQRRELPLAQNPPALWREGLAQSCLVHMLFFRPAAL